MKRDIVSISHALIMPYDLSHRFRTIKKHMVNILSGVNLLSDVLQSHYTNVKLLSPSPHNELVILKLLKILSAPTYNFTRVSFIFH